MTSDEVKSRLWEAYKAGRGVNEAGPSFSFIGLEEVRQDFNNWLIEAMPEVANAEEPYFDKRAEDGQERCSYCGQYDCLCDAMEAALRSGDEIIV